MIELRMPVTDFAQVIRIDKAHRGEHDLAGAGLVVSTASAGEARPGDYRAAGGPR
jgi:hypothetical protein